MSVSRVEDDLRSGPFTDDLPSIIAAAHELKSPLALIRQLSLFAQDYDLSHDEKNEIIQKIVLTSEKALRLTSDLTKSVNLDGAMFQLEPINPCQVCEEVIHELSPLFKAYGRNLKLKYHSWSPLVVANRDLLRRVVINFSENALSYCGQSGLVNIMIKESKSKGLVQIGVRDFGPAISSDLLKQIKNKLPTNSSSVYSRPQSSGLGLYISSKFAELMGGSVGVTRHHDGTTFYINLQLSNQLSLL